MFHSLRLPMVTHLGFQHIMGCMRRAGDFPSYNPASFVISWVQGVSVVLFHLEAAGFKTCSPTFSRSKEICRIWNESTDGIVMFLVGISLLQNSDPANPVLFVLLMAGLYGNSGSPPHLSSAITGKLLVKNSQNTRCHTVETQKKYRCCGGIVHLSKSKSCNCNAQLHVKIASRSTMSTGRNSPAR